MKWKADSMVGYAQEVTLCIQLVTARILN